MGWKRAGLVSIVFVCAALVTSNAPPVAATTTTSPPAISAEADQSLVLRADGTVYAFGSNTSGQLGSLTPVINPANSVPAAVAGLTHVTQIAAGGAHTLVLRDDATAWAFGSNVYGELGIPTTAGAASNPTPQPVAIMPGVTKVFAGAGRSFVVRSDGTTWAFGENDSGALGIAANIGTFEPNPVATQVPVSDVVAMALGNFHTLAVRSDGTVWAFGDNVAGQLGSATNNGFRSANPTPTQVGGLTSIVDVAAGNDFSLALRSDGTVWGFGTNSTGQLGSSVNIGTSTPNPAPSQIAGLSGVVAISAGANFGLALRSDGSVWSFGGYGFFQLGTPPPFAPNPVPAPIPGLSDVTAIAAGAEHVLVLRTDGVVLSFGDNGNGQLGRTIDGAGVGPVRLPARFVPVNPTRILDTRPSSSINYTGPKPSSQMLAVPVKVVGNAGVPSSATAISGTLTLTETALDPGYAQVLTPGALLGTTSNVNFQRLGQTVSNSVIAPLGPDGSLSIFVSTSAHLALDITGYFVPTVALVSAGRLVPLTPTRVFDTRAASAVNYSGAKPVGGSVTRVPVAGHGSVPQSGVSAAVLSLTANETTASGFVQVAPAGQLVPGASSALNVEQADQTISKQIIVPLGIDGAVDVYTQGGANLIVDVAGYITDDKAASGTAGLFVPSVPVRALDTRPQTFVGYQGPKPSAGAVVSVSTQNRGGIPSIGVAAVAANVTITQADAPGFVQAAAAGSLVPGASSLLNVTAAGQTIPNAGIIPTTAGRFDLYTQSGGHLLADVFGYFTD